MRVIEFLKRVIRKMMPIKDDLHLELAVSNTMINAINAWARMYADEPPWKGGCDNVRTLNLPAVVCEELARLMMSEAKSTVTAGEQAQYLAKAKLAKTGSARDSFLRAAHSVQSGSARADYLNAQYADMFSDLRNVRDHIERALALGGVVLKPFVSYGRIETDFVYANKFAPVSFNSNKEITSALFADQKTIGRDTYTRLEYHVLEGTGYSIFNTAYCKHNYTADTMNECCIWSADLGSPCELSAVPEWAEISPKVHIENVNRMLFAYFRPPRANWLDPDSPIGVSVFARAEHAIEEADRQFTRILWEYKATEAAVFADSTLFKPSSKGEPLLPIGMERIYRVLDGDSKSSDGISSKLKEYAPSIRDVSLFNGLNKWLRIVELQTGLAYGTISDVNEVEKTASEIVASKQRSQSTVSALQSALEKTLGEYVAAMDTLATLYGLAPEGGYELSFEWGDSIVTDTNLEFSQRMQMNAAGLLDGVPVLAWYFGCSEEEAKAMMPKKSKLFDGRSDQIEDEE